MSHENKNIYTSVDGTKTGVHIPNPTAPWHVGTDQQVDGNSTVSGTSTTGDLSVTNNATITGEIDAQQGIKIGDFTGDPSEGQLRYNGGQAQYWNGSEWVNMADTGEGGGFDLQTDLSFVYYGPGTYVAYNMASETPPDTTPAMSIQEYTYTPTFIGMDANPLHDIIEEANA
jgi:hypothetical protein